MQRTKSRSADGLQALDDEAVSQAVAPGTGAAIPSPNATRINPRTGKPLMMPKPLSLSPHPMSPIVPEYPDAAGGGLISETHEEVITFQDTIPN